MRKILKRDLRTISFGIGIFAIAALGIGMVSARSPRQARPMAEQQAPAAADSLAAIQAAAAAGDAEAQNTLGRLYYLGQGVPQDYTAAAKWWAASAQQRNVKAIGNLGLCYHLGHGVEADSVKATELMKRSIKDGNESLLANVRKKADADDLFYCALLADCYRQGIGVKRSLPSAAPYLVKIADSQPGTPEPRVNAALNYLNGGMPEDAYGQFLIASRLESPVAIFYIGKMKCEGLGTEIDSVGGVKYLTKAADLEFPQAYFLLGKLNAEGRFMPKDMDKARQLVTKASDKGIGNAEWTLAEWYRTGNSLPVDFERALYWYSTCYPKGHSRAFIRMMNEQPTSPFMTFLKFEDAMNKGNAEQAAKFVKALKKEKYPGIALLEADLLLMTDNPARNVKKGVKLLEKQAKTSPAAMYRLAQIYSAEGEYQDTVKARDLESRVANSGYTPLDSTKVANLLKGVFNQ